MWVKICGTTNLEDAQLAVDAGADALGFVFAESPRRIAPETAYDVIRSLPDRVEKVGVFVNESAERVADIVRWVGLNAVQLHGDGTLDFEKRLAEQDLAGRSLRVIHVVSMGRIREVLDEGGLMIKFSQLKPGNALLLDSGTPAKRGGTGNTWNWELGKDLIESFTGNVNVIIAGGLTPLNVTAAIATLRPWGVDVVSGVEREPGKKDPVKVRAFVKAAKQGHL